MAEGLWEIWVVIADAPDYEINKQGYVRRIKTGRILTPYGPYRMYKLTIDKYYHIGRSEARLLEEAFGGDE